MINVLMYKPERESAFLIICERHSINLAKGNQGRSCRALKRFDSKNEFDYLKVYTQFVWDWFYLSGLEIFSETVTNKEMMLRDK